jgi:predicted O-linked N-acetylglucosamine transferase (SPINDLY family)
MQLIIKMLELHDRSAFEIHGFSLGPDYDDGMRKRLVKTFDSFHDVREMPDQDIAELARSQGIDIAIDLTGYTQNGRSAIFPYRPAPVQVNYLGYPGTMGADFIDYIIADRTLVPEQSQKFYSEKIVYMPHCYQVSDNSRPAPEAEVSRAELGLPETGFVFCCFNHNYKITPREFDIWMQLLTKVESSVLWLRRSNEWAEVNLKKEAETRGVDPGRLIFAEKCDYSEYLMRMTKADLFLDTFNYNAGAVANDALWCGLPVLTLQGQSYVARMACSLLTAIGLPELITTSVDEYEQLAFDLATNPEKLSAIKDRLSTERDNSVLFDTGQFTKDIETAYRRMYDRYFAGETPAHLFVDEQERR